MNRGGVLLYCTVDTVATNTVEALMLSPQSGYKMSLLLLTHQVKTVDMAMAVHAYVDPSHSLHFSLIIYYIIFSA